MGAIKDAFKFSFGASLGYMAVRIIAIALGLAFLLPGIALINDGNDKNGDKTMKYYFGLVLAIIGGVILLSSMSFIVGLGDLGDAMDMFDLF
jgi:hypothetical protein